MNKAKSIFYIIKPFLYYYFIEIIVIYFTSVITENKLHNSYYNAAGNIVAVLLLLHTCHNEIKIQKKYLSSSTINIKSKLILFILCIILGSTLSILFNTIFQIVSNLMQTSDILGSKLYSHVFNIQYSLPIFSGFIIHCIITPICEEIIFRGIIFNRLKRYTNIPNSIIISALIFGIYHGNLPQLIYAFIMGIIIATIYNKTNNLLSPVLFHITANSTSYFRTIFTIDCIQTTNIGYFFILTIITIICGLYFKHLTINSKKLIITH